MGTYATTAKDLMLDACTVNQMSLHTGDPGAAGTANEVTGGSYVRKACTFAASSGGARNLSAQVDFNGPASGAATWIGLWQGATFRGSDQLAGDTAFNASGEFHVTTATQMTISDT